MCIFLTLQLLFPLFNSLLDALQVLIAKFLVSRLSSCHFLSQFIKFLVLFNFDIATVMKTQYLVKAFTTGTSSF